MTPLATQPVDGERLAALLRRARALEDALRQLEGRSTASSEGERQPAWAAERLARSVVRPLASALGRLGIDECQQATTGGADASMPSGSGTVRDAGTLLSGDLLWELARDATELRVAPGAPAELLEATAALQDLACRFAPTEEVRAARRAELRSTQGGLQAGIRCQPNGPYLVANVDAVTNWLGERLSFPPQMALCRCGKSAIKPLCDGTHAEIGFTSDKDPQRVPDQVDSYAGQQVSILDNRGTCQHSGRCTDRLPTVFRLGREPFIAPSGARMDEIVRTVRDCPSGALSFAVDGAEARDAVDYHGTREPAIEVSKDGPYRVTGGVRLTDGDDRDEPRNQGSSREHYALCRCGLSQNKPFCSGMHWYVGFADPVRKADQRPTLFEWAGGLPGFTRMTRIFYEKYVPEDPLLAPLFAEMSPDHPQRVAKWLSEVFCGPRMYSQEYGGYPRMLSQHLGRALSEEQRARWVQLILRSAQEAGLPADAEFRSVFTAYIEWGSRLALENSQPGATPPPRMPMPHWDWMTAAGPPGSRISALPSHADPDPPVVLPSAGEAVTFEKHVRTLFRPRDRRAMSFVFDLGSYEDVTRHAAEILERVRNGSMPCDGPWSAEKVEAFARWVDTGMAR